MGRNLNPKCKQCRRSGERLFLKGERCLAPKCAIVKRNYPPGTHGSKNRQRMTDYGQQLMEKQKARRQYQLLEKQFRLIFEKARRQTGNTGDNFLKLLETRLDNTVYRLGIASSRTQARQLVNHGHFTVNGKKSSIPSYQVKIGDIIGIKANKKDSNYFKNITEKLKKQEVPGWLHFDNQAMTAKVLGLPAKEAITVNFNPQMIIEFYSR